MERFAVKLLKKMSPEIYNQFAGNLWDILKNS